MEEEIRQEKSLETRHWICLARSIIESGLNDFPDDESELNYFRSVSYYSLHGELPANWSFCPSVKPIWRYTKEILDFGINKYLKSKGPRPGTRNNPNGRRGKELSEN